MVVDSSFWSVYPLSPCSIRHSSHFLVLICGCAQGPPICSDVPVARGTDVFLWKNTVLFEKYLTKYGTNVSGDLIHTFCKRLLCVGLTVGRCYWFNTTFRGYKDYWWYHLGWKSYKIHNSNRSCLFCTFIDVSEDNNFVLLTSLDSSNIATCPESSDFMFTQWGILLECIC